MRAPRLRCSWICFRFLPRQCAGAVSAAGGFLIKINTGLYLRLRPGREHARSAFLFDRSPRISVQLNTFACAARWLPQRFRRMI